MQGHGRNHYDCNKNREAYSTCNLHFIPPMFCLVSDAGEKSGLVGISHEEHQTKGKNRTITGYVQKTCQRIKVAY